MCVYEDANAVAVEHVEWCKQSMGWGVHQVMFSIGQPIESEDPTPTWDDVIGALATIALSFGTDPQERRH